MKWTALIFGLLAVFAVGGLTWLSVTDIDVPQSTVTKTISNERFFNAPDSN